MVSACILQKDTIAMPLTCTDCWIAAGCSSRPVEG